MDKSIELVFIVAGGKASGKSRAGTTAESAPVRPTYATAKAEATGVSERKIQEEVQLELARVAKDICLRERRHS